MPSHITHAHTHKHISLIFHPRMHRLDIGVLLNTSAKCHSHTSSLTRQSKLRRSLYHNVHRCYSQCHEQHAGFFFFRASDLSSWNHTKTFNISAQIGGLITQQCIHGQERLPVQNRMLKKPFHWWEKQEIGIACSAIAS